MNPSHLPRRTRARPRYSYAPHTLDAAQERGRQLQRRAYSGHGVYFVRCGGGYRIVRRFTLPGDEQR